MIQLDKLIDKNEHNNNNNSINFNTLSIESHSNGKSPKGIFNFSESNQLLNNNNNNNGQLHPKYSQSALYLQNLIYPSASKQISSFAALSLMASKSITKTNNNNNNNQEATMLNNNNSSSNKNVNNIKKHKCDGCDKAYTKSKNF